MRLPVLFVHYGDDWLRGSEQVLLGLIANLDRDKIEPILWCNNKPLSEAARKAGIVTYVTRFEPYFDYGSKRFDLLHYRATVREGSRLVRRHGIRVLHANSAAPTQWVVPVARRHGLPLLTHLHTTYLRRSRYVSLLHQADLLVGVSEEVVQALRHDGVPERRIKVIYNGIDFKRLTAAPPVTLRTELGVPYDTILVGAAGSLIRRKGYDVLLRAFARLAAEKPPHLVIAGSGSEDAALRQLAVETGIADRVHFLGYRSEIADICGNCDIFAGPSRAEAFGLVYAEAGFFRRPVVATRVGGIPEVVSDEETGLLVPPEDIDALTGALQRLLVSSELRHRLGEAGRQRVESLFSAERMSCRFTSEYLKLASSPRAGLGWGSLLHRMGPYVRLWKRRPFNLRRVS